MALINFISREGDVCPWAALSMGPAVQTPDDLGWYFLSPIARAGTPAGAVLTLYKLTTQAPPPRHKYQLGYSGYRVGASLVRDTIQELCEDAVLRWTNVPRDIRHGARRWLKEEGWLS
jgi:hypothetical protein